MMEHNDMIAGPAGLQQDKVVSPISPLTLHSLDRSTPISESRRKRHSDYTTILGSDNNTTHCSSPINQSIQNEETDNLITETRDNPVFPPIKFEFQLKLKEPSLPSPPENYKAVLEEFQKFNKNEWTEVKCNDIQKQYNHSSGFIDLKVNEEFKDYDHERSLAYDDKAFGALTFGLMRQRDLLEKNMNQLVNFTWNKGNSINAQELREKIVELFSVNGYQKVTSEILQIVCGHRAEKIQLRRDSIMSYAQDQTIKRELRKIPPSIEYIFNNTMLNALLEQSGGVKNVLRPPNKSGNYRSTCQPINYAAENQPNTKKRYRY